MDYPSLPTDNLYKFLALAGLALAVFSVSYPVGKTVELELQEVDANAEIERLRLEVSKLSQLVSSVQSKKAEERTVPDVINLQEKLTLIERRTIDVTALDSKVAVQRRWIEYYKAAARFGAVLGFALLACGLVLWFTRVQLPADVAAKAAAATPPKSGT